MKANESNGTEAEDAFEMKNYHFFSILFWIFVIDTFTDEISICIWIEFNIVEYNMGH